MWSTENTRGAIWDALKRKEAYSTTGPRVTVRFFGGWDFDPKDAHARMPAEAKDAMSGNRSPPPCRPDRRDRYCVPGADALETGTT